MNSTEITAENFFNALLKRFREDQKRLREQKEMPNGSIGQTPKRVSLLPFQSGSAIDAENQRKDSSQIATSTSRDVNTPSSTSISPIDSNQQNALSYVDDEDMVNDYDNVDGSGTRPLWNDTAATFAILNDNDVNNDSDWNGIFVIVEFRLIYCGEIFIGNNYVSFIYYKLCVANLEYNMQYNYLGLRCKLWRKL